MPDGEVEPVGRFGPDLAEVAAEMSEVFLQAGWGLSDSRPGETAGAGPALRSGGASARIILTALAAGVVGFGAGAFIARAPRTPVVGDSGSRTVTQPQPPARLQTATQYQSPAAPPTVLIQADPVPVTAVPPANASPATTLSPGRAKASAKAQDRHRVKLQRVEGPKAAAARPQVRMRRASMAMAQPASCERDSRGEACHQAVLRADEHLRDVYQQAVRRGVSSEVLGGYRSRWASLRDQRSEDPTRLIEGYGAMAYDLGRENAR